MRPLLRSGEVLPIMPADGASVRPGDIVLYRIGSKRLLHRVWRADARSLWMKDDTGTVDLHRVPRQRVLGLLVGRYPLSRGLCGLAYSRAVTLAFLAARGLRRVCFAAG